MTALLIASFVALYSVILVLRGRWDVHLLVTLVAYALYHGPEGLRQIATRIRRLTRLLRDRGAQNACIGAE